MKWFLGCNPRGYITVLNTEGEYIPIEGALIPQYETKGASETEAVVVKAFSEHSTAVDFLETIHTLEGLFRDDDLAENLETFANDCFRAGRDNATNFGHDVYTHVVNLLITGTASKLDRGLQKPGWADSYRTGRITTTRTLPEPQEDGSDRLQYHLYVREHRVLMLNLRTSPGARELPIGERHWRVTSLAYQTTALGGSHDWIHLRTGETDYELGLFQLHPTQ